MSPRFGITVRSVCAFDLPVVAFATSALLATGAAHDVTSAHRAVAWAMGLAGMAVLVGWLARSRAAWGAVAMLAVGSGACVALFFVTQYSALEVESKIGTIDALGQMLSAAFPRLPIWAPFSNSAATWLEGLWPLSIGLAADPRNRRVRLPVVVASAVMALALLLTMSRGAWVAILAGAIVWLSAQSVPSRWRAHVAGASVVGALTAGLAMTFDAGLTWVARLSAAAGGFIVRPDRLNIYHGSVSLLRDVGLTGLGPGDQFADPFSRFALIIQVPFVTYPHHLSLHLWLAGGVLGIAAWAWWVGSCASAIVAAERHRATPASRGAWVGFFAVLMHGLTDARQAVDPWTWAPLFVLAGLIVARCRRLDPGVRPGVLALPLACLLATGALALGRYVPVTAAWQSSIGHQLEARCLFGSTPDSNRQELCASAVDRYERAIAEDPSQVGAHRRLALAAAERGQFSLAASHAREAFTYDTSSPATRKVTGLTAAWVGDERLAVELLVTVPGSANELLVWSSAWKDRRFTDASLHSAAVARMLEERSSGE
jgi:O-antigen ligase